MCAGKRGSQNKKGKKESCVGRYQIVEMEEDGAFDFDF